MNLCKKCGEPIGDPKKNYGHCSRCSSETDGDIGIDPFEEAPERDPDKPTQQEY